MISNNLEVMITDPVSFEYIEDAQITNCKHCFSLESALQIFGEMKEEQCVKQAPCPLCNRIVTKYESCPFVQGLVDEVLKEKERLALKEKEILALKESLAAKSQNKPVDEPEKKQVVSQRFADYFSESLPEFEADESESSIESEGEPVQQTFDDYVLAQQNHNSGIAQNQSHKKEPILHWQRDGELLDLFLNKSNGRYKTEESERTNEKPKSHRSKHVRTINRPSSNRPSNTHTPSTNSNRGRLTSQDMDLLMLGRPSGISRSDWKEHAKKVIESESNRSTNRHGHKAKNNKHVDRKKT